MKAKKKPAKLSVRIFKLMSDGKPRSAKCVADALGVDSEKASHHLRHFCKPGINRKYQSIDRLGPRKAIRYIVGNGENLVERPYDVNFENLSDEELDAMHRRNNADFPKVDPVLLNAINSMVRVGVRA